MSNTVSKWNWPAFFSLITTLSSTLFAVSCPIIMIGYKFNYKHAYESAGFKELPEPTRFLLAIPDGVYYAFFFSIALALAAKEFLIKSKSCTIHINLYTGLVCLIIYLVFFWAMLLPMEIYQWHLR